MGGVASPGEGDVAGLAVETGRADDVDVIAGESLGFVDGGRVAVIDAACLHIVAGELEASAVAEFDVDVGAVVVDVGDGGDHSVVDTAPLSGVKVELSRHVAQQDDTVTDLKRPTP